jgi:hypothetical protein
MSKGDTDPLAGDDEVEAEAKAEAARLARAREMDDFKWLMGHKQGRRIMWRMLDMTGVFRNPHIPGTDDVLFRCGMQNVGQQLMTEIHTICPEHYPTMTKEHVEWQQKHQQ